MKKLETKTYQTGAGAWSMEQRAWNMDMKQLSHKTEYNDQTKSEGKHRD